MRLTSHLLTAHVKPTSFSLLRESMVNGWRGMWFVIHRRDIYLREWMWAVEALNVGVGELKMAINVTTFFSCSITHKWKSLTQSTILAASITSRTTLSPTFYYHSFVLITLKKRRRVNYSYLVSNWCFPFQVLILVIIIRIYKDEYILFMLSLQKMRLFQCLQNCWNSIKIWSKCLSWYFFFSAFQIIVQWQSV